MLKLLQLFAISSSNCLDFSKATEASIEKELSKYHKETIKEILQGTDKISHSKFDMP
jgi:hypothetical protein